MLLGIAANAQGNGLGRVMELTVVPAYVSVCAEARPALAQRLRSANEELLARLSPDERKFRQEWVGTGQERKALAELRKKFRALSEEEVTDHCEEQLAYLSARQDIPDPALSSPKATWETFLRALRAGDRRAALKAMAGSARERWREFILEADAARLVRLANTYHSFALSGDEYGGVQEAFVLGKDE